MKTQLQERTSSYGEQGLSLVDRFGVYLSKRMILRQLRRQKDLTVLDIGCGYHAKLLTTLSPNIREGIGIDLSISDQAKSIPNLSFVEDNIENVLPSLPKNYFDLIFLISVLEHLWQPQQILSYCNEMLKPGGMLLFNVPTWRGKYFLEYSAFTLGTSPACEMEDHKMYYNQQEIWPLLVQSGFKPSQIHLKYIKFGLNLFGRVCKSDYSKKKEAP